MDINESIVTALVIGAQNDLSHKADSEIKSVYNRIKEIFVTRYPRIGLDVLREKSDSEIRQRALVEILGSYDLAKDADLLATAKMLLNRYERKITSVSESIGVSIENVKAASLSIQDIEFFQSGLQIKNSHFDDDISIVSIHGPLSPKNNQNIDGSKNQPSSINFENSSAGKIHLGDKYYFLFPGGASLQINQSEPESTSPTTQTIIPQDDWLKLFETDVFHDREHEVGIIVQWVTKESSHIVGIFGIGGIGKTTLLTKIAVKVVPLFDHIIGLSLINKPPMNTILQDCIEILSNDPGISIPEFLDNKLTLLYRYLRSSKNLIILDNIETVLSSDSSGEFIPEYESIGHIIRFMGEKNHTSCLILAGREIPKDFSILVGETYQVRSLKLTGFNVLAAREFLKNKGLFGTEELWRALIEKYSGNPLILRIVSATIRELYDKDISEFLISGGTPSDDTFRVIEAQFVRLSEIEKDVLYLLAIEREPVRPNEIEENLFGYTLGQIISALESLQRRSLIEKFGRKFGLQNVVLEYVTERLHQAIFEELKMQRPKIFNSHPLLIAFAKDYIRSIQTELIIEPILARLEKYYAGRESVKHEIYRLLSMIRENKELSSGYSTGNIINMLVRLQGNLDHLDFSKLIVRHAFLRGVPVRNSKFSESTFYNSVFTENFSGILSLAYSGDGQFLAAGTFSGDIWIWQQPNSNYIKTLHGHTDWVWDIKLSPDGRYCISCSEDQTIRIWSVENESTLRVFKAKRWVRSIGVNFEQGILAFSNGDNIIEIRNIFDGKHIATLDESPGSVLKIEISADGKKLVSGKDSYITTLWNLENKQIERVFIGHQDMVRALAFSGDGKKVATGSHDMAVRIWDVSTGDCISVLEGHKAWVRSVLFDRTGFIVASCANDGEIRLWNISNNECFRVMRGQHAGPVWAINYHPQEDVLVSGGGDQKIQFWNSETGEPISMLKGYADVVWALAFKPESKSLISGGDRKVVQMWDISKGNVTSELYGHRDTIWALDFSPDGRYFVSASGDKTIKIWETETLHAIRTLKNDRGLVWNVKFSPNQDLLASCGTDYRVKLWNINTGEQVRILEGHDDDVWGIAFSPDGRLLASASDDHTVRLWNIESESIEPIRVYSGHSSWVRSVVFSLDGKHLITGSGDQTCKIWDVKSGEIIYTLEGHTSWIKSVTIHPGNKIIATGSGDQTIRLWEIDTGKCIQVLRGHKHLIRALAFTSDGGLLASSAEDGEIRIWDIEEKKCICVLMEGRPYEGMNINRANGLLPVQISMLKYLGAIDSE